MPKLTPSQAKTREAVRALANAALFVDPQWQPRRRRELAQLALNAYGLAIEYDSGWYLEPALLDAVHAIVGPDVKGPVL